MNTCPMSRRANSVAAQMWRHQAMPTSEPCGLYDISIGKAYLWVIYWGEELPSEHHFPVPRGLRLAHPEPGP